MSIALVTWPSNLQQPDVTANANNRVLQVLVQLGVEAIEDDAPTTVIGDVGKAWIVGTGTWPDSSLAPTTPIEHDVAVCVGANLWQYLRPNEGWEGKNLDTGDRIEFDGTEWVVETGGGGSGTVTSVGLSLPDIFSISGSPVTTTGTLTATPVDPGADRLIFWDDSDGKWVYLTLGTNLSITGTTINASGSGSTTVDIVTESGTSTMDPATHAGTNRYLRCGGDVTFDSAEPYAAGEVYNIRATSAIELIEDGVTLTPPAGGTLELDAAMSVTVTMTSSTAGDVIGQTVPV